MRYFFLLAHSWGTRKKERKRDQVRQFCGNFAHLKRERGSWKRRILHFFFFIMTLDTAQKMTISERRASYPLQERLKMYDPNSMAQRLDDLQKQPRKLVLHGVNVLNKVSVDSDTAMNRIRQRRETHNRVERRRRDNLVKCDIKKEDANVSIEYTGQ